MTFGYFIQPVETVKKGVFGTGTEAITSEFEGVVKLAKDSTSSPNISRIYFFVLIINFLSSIFCVYSF